VFLFTNIFIVIAINLMDCSLGRHHNNLRYYETMRNMRQRSPSVIIAYTQRGKGQKDASMRLAKSTDTIAEQVIEFHERKKKRKKR